MDWWNVIWTGVVVGVIVGLILGAIFGGLRWYARRRERKAKEAEQRRFDRIPLVAGLRNITRELRENAAVAERCEVPDHVSAEAHRHLMAEARFLSLTQWRGFRDQIGGLRAEDPALWRELETTYEALGQTKAHGANPPSCANLLDLADRLDKAAEGD